MAWGAVITALCIALGTEIVMNETVFGFETPPLEQLGIKGLTLLVLTVLGLFTFRVANENAWFRDEYKLG